MCPLCILGYISFEKYSQQPGQEPDRQQWAASEEC